MNMETKEQGLGSQTLVHPRGPFPACPPPQETLFSRAVSPGFLLLLVPCWIPCPFVQQLLAADSGAPLCCQLLSSRFPSQRSLCSLTFLFVPLTFPLASGSWTLLLKPLTWPSPLSLHSLCLLIPIDIMLQTPRPPTQLSQRQVSILLLVQADS